MSQGAQLPDRRSQCRSYGALFQGELLGATEQVLHPIAAAAVSLFALSL